MSNIAVPADEQTLTIVREKLGLSSNDLEQIMEQPWFGAAVKEAWRESQKIAKVERISSNLSKYIHNPIGFCTDYLGVTFTDDILKLIEAVQKSPVVIAKSGNAVGKSHSAARIAVWYYLVHKDAKVFMTAAPPLARSQSRVVLARASRPLPSRQSRPHSPCPAAGRARARRPSTSKPGQRPAAHTTRRRLSARRIYALTAPVNRR